MQPSPQANSAVSPGWEMDTVHHHMAVKCMHLPVSITAMWWWTVSISHPGDTAEFAWGLGCIARPAVNYQMVTQP